MHEGYLFSKANLSDWLARRQATALAAAGSIPGERALQVPEADLIDELMEQYEVRPPILRLEERYIADGAQDVRIDVSRDPRRVVFDRDLPLYVPGTRLAVHIPFNGDPVLFQFRPSTFTTVFPRGEIRGQELIVSHQAPADSLTPEEFQGRLNEELDRIQRYLGWVVQDCESFNRELRQALDRAVRDRREKVLRDRDLEAFLRIPVGRRSEPSPLFRVPVPKRRKIGPAKPDRPGTLPFSPEPAISDEDYAAILETITDWRASVERLPGTFGPMGEEVLRDNLLVVLNNQFGTGGGELFSRKGKTDIFIQQHKGAVFIAECKVWSGSKAFAEALDQLLGYLVWRDTKSALVLFVRRKNVSEIKAKAEDTIRGHARFKRQQGAIRGVPIYVLHHEGDPNREIEVALVVIPLPAPGDLSRTARS